MSNVIPQQIKRQIMSALNQPLRYAVEFNGACYGILDGRRMFSIADVPTNAWLTKQFGMVTDDNTQELGGFVFWFDWVPQLWRVGV